MLFGIKRVYWRLYWWFKPWREGRSDLQAELAFLMRRDMGVSFGVKLELLRRFIIVSRRIDLHHTQHEMLQVAAAILKFPRDVPGVVIEAGCYKGGSTAKFSLCCALAGRRLIVFELVRGHSGEPGGPGRSIAHQNRFLERSIHRRTR